MCTGHILSMLLLLQVVRLLELVKYSFVSPQQLREAIIAHLEAYKRIYGDDVRPKFHYPIHLAKMLQKFGLMKI